MVTMTDDRELGYALGATEFLTKPVNRGQLVQLLQRYTPAGRRALRTGGGRQGGEPPGAAPRPGERGLAGERGRERPGGSGRW